MSHHAAPVDSRQSASLGRRLLLVWPARAYDYNEGLAERLPFFLYRLGGLLLGFGLMALGGGLGALIAAFSSHQGEIGFWIGVSVTCCAMVLLAVYIAAGGVAAWLLNRQRRAAGDVSPARPQ